MRCQEHERETSSTAWIEICWKCALDYWEWIADHPGDRSPLTLVWAIPPGTEKSQYEEIVRKLAGKPKQTGKKEEE